MNQVMIDGRLVPAAEARLGVSDLGLLRGYAVFDFFRVLRGKPLFVQDYLRRFQNSARLLGLEPPFDLASLEAQVHRFIQANDLQDAGLHLLLTGGDSPDGFTPGAPTLVLQARALKPSPPEVYRQGAKLISHAYARDIPEAKTTNYCVALALFPQQREAGAVDILFHRDGLVSETARSNVFIVQGGVLRTPENGVLPGVTRKQLLELAREHGPLELGPVQLEDVFAADEVFITSSLKGVMPIVALDGKSLGDGQPGPLTRHLMRAFAERVEAYLGAGVTR